MAERELTGRTVLTITLVAFGIILSVNLLLAWQAVRTFPGLEVANSYVASQSFDADRAAQQALGWTATPDYTDGILTLTFRDRDGRAARVQTVSAIVGRPTHTRDDVTPEFSYRGGLWSAPVTLAPGVWNIRLTATAPDGTLFRQRIDQYHGNRVKG